MLFKKRKRKDSLMTLDEIFMDSKNIPGFETERLEGRLEKPISRKVFLGLAIFYVLAGGFLFFRTFELEIIQGESLALRAEDNHLKKIVIPSNRGIIYDRQGKELAWNEPASRAYTDFPGLNLLTGYVGAKDGVGKEGIEKIYDSELRGISGLEIIETNSKGEIVSSSIQSNPKDGENITLSIEADLQSEVYSVIENLAKERGFQAGAGVIINVENGQVLAMASYPEYEAEVLAKGEPKEKIEEFLIDPRKPFLNRAVSGLYAPGSIIKPLLALAALEQGIISPEKQIFSAGSISIPNPFFPDKKSVFYDWKPHGWVDMRQALAVSSDVYFYTIGGGFENISGLGIDKIKEYAGFFGLGSKTGIDLNNEKPGIVPGPEQKKITHPQDPVWRVGDTYNASIGQGNFQVTPIQMAVFTAALANGGKILTPRLRFNLEHEQKVEPRLSISPENFQVVQEGMQRAVLEGTAIGLSGLGLDIAGKTGTAEIGSGEFVNSWFIGFFPFDNPQFAMAIVMEKGRAENLVGAVSAARQILQWLVVHKPEYLNFD